MNSHTSRKTTNRGRLDEIIEAAASIFHEKGYDATSMQDVADAVGILKGSLYYYVDSKEDLLFAIIEDFLDEVVSNAEEVRASDGDPADRLAALLTGHILLLTCRSVGASVLYGELRSLERLMTGPRRQRFLERRSRYEDYIQELITGGQALGVFSKAFDPKTISYGIFWMMNSILQWYRPEGGLSPEEIADQYVQLIMWGLGCDTPRIAPPVSE